MRQVPSSDPDEAGRGIARDTKRKYNELELSLAQMARPGTIWDRLRDSCWIYGVSAVAVLAVLAAFCVYIQPWNRLKGDMRASPYMAFQDKELQCHEGCRQHDLANSICLQECLPEKLNCMSSECDGMSADSTEYSYCALDCHSSVCENKCSDVGRRASLCHLSCAPDMRTLVEDPPCVRKCNAQHDNSCMGGCAESTKKCLNTKCVGNTQEEYSMCQEECELNSCGRDCQASNKAFAECTSHCYPANPSGQNAVFVPPSVQAADNAFLRTSHCKKFCRLSDHRHTLCMHHCGPKITKCVQTQCPNAVPKSDLQKKCMASCEKSSCGDACLQTFNQAKHCYQDSCNPDHASACNKRCQAKHDDSCMKKCGSDLGSCISSHCSTLLDQDANAYSECQQTCMTTHCGADCAQRSLALVSCNKYCDEASSM